MIMDHQMEFSRSEMDDTDAELVRFSMTSPTGGIHWRLMKSSGGAGQEELEAGLDRLAVQSHRRLVWSAARPLG